MGSPDMLLGPAPRIFIEGGDAHDDVGLPWAFGDQLRATYRAEVAQLPRRRLEGRQALLAFDPAKILTLDPSGGGERSRVCFSATAAVAMADRHIDALDGVLDGAT